jgi:hypothetical protein
MYVLLTQEFVIKNLSQMNPLIDEVVLDALSKPDHRYFVLQIEEDMKRLFASGYDPTAFPMLSFNLIQQRSASRISQYEFILSADSPSGC